MNKYNELDVMYIILTSYLITLLIVLWIHIKLVEKAEREIQIEKESTYESNQKMDTKEEN